MIIKIEIIQAINSIQMQFHVSIVKINFVRTFLFEMHFVYISKVQLFFHAWGTHYTVGHYGRGETVRLIRKNSLTKIFFPIAVNFPSFRPVAVSLPCSAMFGNTTFWSRPADQKASNSTRENKAILHVRPPITFQTP